MRPPGDDDLPPPTVARLAHPTRLDPDHPRYEEILAAHDEAVAAGQAGYLDPDFGLFVLTAAWLAERGTCCGRGCRHCPYGPDGSLIAGGTT
jgi:hypothetical protein